MMINSASGNVAIRYGLNGPNFGIVSACASANHSIGTVLRLIRYGDADLMLVGGSEKALTPSGLAGFCAAKALSTRNDEPQRACCPFDKDRDGFILGEGAGVLLFETLDHALARGAKIYAEVFGAGMTCDAFHITAPLESGAQIARSMKLAMEDGNIDPARVIYQCSRYINAI
jgi:3-oxoacyl-[acyl-carrier-protein] synthase II